MFSVRFIRAFGYEMAPGIRSTANALPLNRVPVTLKYSRTAPQNSDTSSTHQRDACRKWAGAIPRCSLIHCMKPGKRRCFCCSAVGRQFAGGSVVAYVVMLGSFLRAGAFVVGQSPMDGPASARGKTLAGPCDLAALMGGASVAAMQLPRRLAVMITAATGSAHPGI